MQKAEATPTRSDYLAGRVDHATYYRAVAKTVGVSYGRADPAFLARVRAAIASGDEHLNTIPLDEWDIRAGSMLPWVVRAFERHGSGCALSDRVCLLKQAARDAVAGEVVS